MKSAPFGKKSSPVVPTGLRERHLGQLSVGIVLVLLASMTMTLLGSPAGAAGTVRTHARSSIRSANRHAIHSVNRRSFPEAGGAQSLDPGAQLAFNAATPGANINIINGDGSGLQQLGGIGGTARYEPLVWSPAGGTLAFYNYSYSTSGCQCVQLVDVSPSGTTSNVRTLSWSTQVQSSCPTITSTTGPFTQTPSLTGLSWSPDGKNIAFSYLCTLSPNQCTSYPCGDTLTYSGIYIGPISGTGSAQLLPNSQGAFLSSWSSTNVIAFIDYDGLSPCSDPPVQVSSGITIESPTGTDVENISSSFLGVETILGISFSPSGQQLAVEGSNNGCTAGQGRDQNIEIVNNMPKKGGPPFVPGSIQDVWNDDSNSNLTCFIGEQAWSPDGSTFACGYELTATSTEECPDTDTYGLQEMSVESGALGPLLDESGYAASGCLGTPVPIDDPAWRGETYVALGDSYSSGDLEPNVPPCKRTLAGEAYPELFAAKVLNLDVAGSNGAPPAFVFAACSGASTEKILKQVKEDLPENASIVTLTAGGDNASLARGLFRVFTSCTKLIGKDKGCPPYPDLIGGPGTGAWATLQGELVSLYQAILDKAPQANLYVMGYPNPLAPPNQLGPTGCSGLNLGSSFLSIIQYADYQFLYNLVNYLDATVQNAIAQIPTRVNYVAPNSNFAAQNVCSNNPLLPSAFVTLSTYLSTLGGDALLHPNAIGQSFMEQSLAAAVAAPNS